MWSVRIPFDSTGTSNNGRPRAEQYANWKFEAEEHEKRLATAQADARQQFRTDAAFFESYRRVCWQKLNGRVKRLLHLK